MLLQAESLQLSEALPALKAEWALGIEGAIAIATDDGRCGWRCESRTPELIDGTGARALELAHALQAQRAVVAIVVAGAAVLCVRGRHHERRGCCDGCRRGRRGYRLLHSLAQSSHSRPRLLRARSRWLPLQLASRKTREQRDGADRSHADLRNLEDGSGSVEKKGTAPVPHLLSEKPIVFRHLPHRDQSPLDT
jgi:hypothetical protein